MVKMARSPESTLGLKNDRSFHKLGADMIPYMRRLAEEAKFEYQTSVLHTVFKHTFCIRTKLGPVSYRLVEYRVDQNQTVHVKCPGDEDYKIYSPDLDSNSSNISC